MFLVEQPTTVCGCCVINYGNKPPPQKCSISKNTLYLVLLVLHPGNETGVVNMWSLIAKYLIYLLAIIVSSFHLASLQLLNMD